MTRPGMAGLVLGGPASGEPTSAGAERPAEPGDAGQALPSAEEVITGTEGPLPGVLPDGTALLRVTRRLHEGAEAFHLELHHDTELRITVASQDLANQRRPAITLAGAAATGTWLQSLRSLRGWSQNKITLRQWLTALRRRYGSRLRLIVWDETDFQIPWELFFHEYDAEDSRGWLGADIPIIRWTTVYTEQQIGWSSGGATVCQGPILSHVAAGFPALDRLLARWPYESAASMKDLLTKLDDASRDVGLVHLWGHGNVGANGEAAVLDGMSLDALGEYRMGALRVGRTLVLLNACGSGQLMGDDRWGESGSRTFAEVFLRRGARGVIATSGPVGKAESSALVRHLLWSAEEREGVTLAAIMREYRAELVGQLPPGPIDDSTDADVLESIGYGFMYLYVGYLDTGLRMSPAGGAG